MPRVARHWAVALFLWSATPAAGAPVAVRFTEGHTHGFLALTDGRGAVIGRGELIQLARGDRVESRLVFRFGDGSLSEETVVFSQARVFRLLSFKILQRGPAFPEALDAWVARDTGSYAARVTGKDGTTDEVRGSMEVPDDLSNGMLALLLQNLPPGQSAVVRMVVFDPKPRLLDVPLAASGQRPVAVGGLKRDATVFAVQPALRGVARLIAPLVGKRPPTLRYYILAGEAPAFLRFEGPFFAGGPIWRVELTRPEWPSAAASPAR